jgi:hypothetical protein
LIEEKYGLAGHCDDENDRVEFHVHTCAFIREEASRRYKYGGKTSIPVELMLTTKQLSFLAKMNPSSTSIC